MSSAGNNVAAAAALVPPADALAWKSPVSPWLISLTVMLATFMEVLDTSIANVSLPNIAGNLSAGIDESTWVLTSYLVSNAIILPLAGWFASLFGRKRFFMICVGVFVVSSFLCGFAPSLRWLVIFRILQGAGGGSMQPLAQAILVESFPKEKRGMGMAVYAMGVVVAPIVGPTVGGWITDNYSWRWIFFINIPIGALSLLMTSMLIHEPPYLHRRKFGTFRIDWLGLGLLSVGLGALQIVLDKGQREDWLASHMIVSLMVVSGVCLLGGFLWELRQKEPVVDVHLLKERNFLIAVIIMFVLGIVLYGSTAILPIFMQTLLGYTAMLSGLVLSPGGLFTLLMLPLVGKLLGRFEARWLVIVGILAVSTSLVMMSRYSIYVDFWSPAIARMVQGVGLAFLFVPINTMAFYFVAKERTNYASGLINLARNLGGSVGIAGVATLLARNSQIHQANLVGNLNPYSDAFRVAQQQATALMTARGYAPVVADQAGAGMLYGLMSRQAAMLAFVDIFQILAVALFVMIPLTFLMKRVKPGGGPSLAH